MTILREFQWTGGTQSGTGSTVVAPSASMHIGGASTKALEGPRTLVNDSTAGSTWTGTGDVDALVPSASEFSSFVNNGLLTIDTDAAWRDYLRLDSTSDWAREARAHLAP